MERWNSLASRISFPKNSRRRSTLIHPMKKRKIERYKKTFKIGKPTDRMCKIITTVIDPRFLFPSRSAHRSKYRGSIARVHRAISGGETRVKRTSVSGVVLRFNNERCNVSLAASYSRGCREIDDSRPGIGNNVLPVFRLTRRFVNVSASQTGSRTIY